MDVTGITVAKAQEIADASIVGAAINPSRQLILTNGGGAEINAGSVDPLPWESFVPKPSAVPGYGVTYARHAVIGGLCHVQVHYTNFQSVVFNPGFIMPVPCASHYSDAVIPPGHLGRMFPGMCHWAGGPTANDVGVLTHGMLDMGLGDGPQHYIFGATRGGSALDTLTAPVSQLFFETTYEIAYYPNGGNQ